MRVRNDWIKLILTRHGQAAGFASTPYTRRTWTKHLLPPSSSSLSPVAYATSRIASPVQVTHRLQSTTVAGQADYSVQPGCTLPFYLAVRGTLEANTCVTCTTCSMCHLTKPCCCCWTVFICRWTGPTCHTQWRSFSRKQIYVARVLQSSHGR